MKKTFFLTTALAISACLCQATTISVASPNDNNYAGDVLSPRFGTYINFDSLTPFSTVATNAFAAQGVQSISSNTSSNPLIAYPYSSQSAPNYLSTASTVTGGITITLSNMVNIIGIGVLASDGNPEILTALGANGTVLGSYSETVPSTGKTPLNAYYVLTDTTMDIKSLVISSTNGSFAIDDLQFAPEPLNVALVGGGLLAMLGLARIRKAKSTEA